MTLQMRRRIFFGAAILMVIAGAVFLYFFNLKFADIKSEKADFEVNAQDLIGEFVKDSKSANVKYTEKIIVVNGQVSSAEVVDTMVNIKIEDTLSGSYVIFAFQSQHANEAKTMVEGDSVSIKGSCSGGSYSQILESTSITFKRCTLLKKF